jgi:hypothetical protein
VDNFLHDIGLAGHIVAFSIAGLVILAAPIALVLCFYSVVRKKVAAKKIAGGLVPLVLAACAVIAAISFSGSTHSAHHPKATTAAHQGLPGAQDAALQFEIPHRGYQGNPLPLVSCVQQISIEGRVPSGDLVVTANEKAGSTGYYFVSFAPADNPSNAKWSTTVDFGDANGGGAVFHLVVFALPASWVAYLDNLYAALNGKGGGWDDGTLPPAAIEGNKEDVRRKKDSCPKN